MNPLVSIITPCFNGEKYLNRYFNSILSQTYRPLELIFVNDGSTDQTENIAKSYSDKLEKSNIKFIYLIQKNKGQAAALNRGLKAFTGDYLIWPDSDDVIAPACIEKKVRFLQQHPDVKMVACNGVYQNESNGSQTLILKEPYNDVVDLFDNLIVVRNLPHPTSFMITTDLLLECYPTKDIYESRTGQNWQLLVPCASRSLCGFINENLMTAYVHEDSHSRKKRSIEQRYQRIHEFAEIEHHAVEASDCDWDKYHKIVEVHKFKQIFSYAVSVNDKNKMKKSLKGIKDNGGTISASDIGLYIKHGYFHFGK